MSEQVKVGDTFHNTDVNDTPIPVGAMVRYDYDDSEPGDTPSNPCTVTDLRRGKELVDVDGDHWGGGEGTITVISLPTPTAPATGTDDRPMRSRAAAAANPNDPRFRPHPTAPASGDVFCPTGCKCGCPAASPATGGGEQAVAMATLFHETYEQLAPSFGYETRADTRTFDPTSKNGRLMIAVCGEVTRHLTAEVERLDKSETQLVQERDDAEECLSQLYYIVTGNSPEWSNIFGHEQAQEDVADVVSTLKACASLLTTAQAELAEARKRVGDLVMLEKDGYQRFLFAVASKFGVQPSEAQPAMKIIDEGIDRLMSAIRECQGDGGCRAFKALTPPPGAPT